MFILKIWIKLLFEIIVFGYFFVTVVTKLKIQTKFFSLSNVLTIDVLFCSLSRWARLACYVHIFSQVIVVLGQTPEGYILKLTTK